MISLSAEIVEQSVLMNTTNNQPKQAGFGFQTTQWSLVLQAREGDSSDAQAALETLCRAYWRPIFHFIRARGHQGEEAQDLTQEFFRVVIEKGYFEQADPDRGRFRAFLKGSIKNFLANEWKKSKRTKRGGEFEFCSFDEFEEERFQVGDPSTVSPDRAYDRQWARSTFDTTLSRVREEMAGRGHGGRFELYKPFLLPRTSDTSYSEAAASAGLTEQAFKSGMYRFRERVRAFFMEEVANTISDPRDLESEARELMKALAER